MDKRQAATLALAERIATLKTQLGADNAKEYREGAKALRKRLTQSK